MDNIYLEEHKRRNLRRCQLKMLGILEEIDRICKMHDIEYWLDGGTLLGAVRHSGFIPWDDDIDIAMRKEDMDRFCKVAMEELPNNLFLQTMETDPESKTPIVKVRDLNSIFIEFGDSFNLNYQKGIFVDIFPFVDYPTISRSLTKKITRGISVSNSIMHDMHHYSFRSLANLLYFGTKRFLFQIIWKVLLRLRPTNTFFCVIPENNGYGVTYRKDSIFPLSEIEFEGKKFSAPRNTDAYLKDLFGNYMEIPPKEKQKIHAVFMVPELIEK